jgi:hypothetical protein
MMPAMPDHARTTPGERTVPGAKSFLGPATLALLTLLAQVVLRRELAPGEFGTLNALLGVLLVVLVPFAALSAILRRELAGAKHATWHGPLLNRAALAWGLACAVLLFVALPVLQLPRSSLQFFTLPAVAAGLLAICGRPATPARWCLIIGIAAAALRLVVSAWAAADWPTAESGLGAFLLAALVAGLPALRDQPEPGPLRGAWKILRPALVPTLAALGIALALALFTNADRIAAQLNLGTIDPNHVTGTDSSAEPFAFVDYRLFDDYEAAGLVARGLLWSLLPLLGLFYAQRVRLTSTTRASLRWFWIYLGALLLGALFLVVGAPVANALFNPYFFQHADAPRDVMIGNLTALLPAFAGAFVLLGLVQAVAVFALASKRHVECFVLAACSVAYTAVLFETGHHALLMTAIMAGGALMSLALVLLVGVVRYARSHP